MAISFKDVGVLKEIGSTFTEQNRSLTPIGVKTPLELDKYTNNIFAMHTDIRAQIADNLRNLLQTNWGERLAITNYGANLRPLATEFSSIDNFNEEAIVRINTAVSLWMPFLELIEYDARPDYDTNDTVGKIKILVSYAIPTLSVPKDILEVTIYII